MEMTLGVLAPWLAILATITRTSSSVAASSLVCGLELNTNAESLKWNYLLTLIDYVMRVV